MHTAEIKSRVANQSNEPGFHPANMDGLFLGRNAGGGGEERRHGSFPLQKCTKTPSLQPNQDLPAVHHEESGPGHSSYMVQPGNSAGEGRAGLESSHNSPAQASIRAVQATCGECTWAK